MAFCMSTDCSYLGTVAPAGSFKGWPFCTWVVCMPAWPPGFTGVSGLVIAVLAPYCSFFIFCLCSRLRGKPVVVPVTYFIQYFTSALLYVPVCLVLLGPNKSTTSSSGWFSVWELGAALSRARHEQLDVMTQKRRYWVMMGKGGGCWPKA